MTTNLVDAPPHRLIVAAQYWSGDEAARAYNRTALEAFGEFAVLIGLGDGLVHFIMDRIKASPKYMGRWKMLLRLPRQRPRSN